MIALLLFKMFAAVKYGAERPTALDKAMQSSKH